MSDVHTVFPAEVIVPVYHARDLFRKARFPRSDATWPAIRSSLVIVEAMLADSHYPGGDELLAEVRRYLGRRPPPPQSYV